MLYIDKLIKYCHENDLIITFNFFDPKRFITVNNISAPDAETMLKILNVIK